MGLPLFVEPGKSVSSNKISSKDNTTSPSHADSRRPSSRSEIRDRRNGIRRAGVRIYGSVQRATQNSREQRYLSWVGSPRQDDRAGSSVANPSTRAFRFRPYQEALLSIGGSDDPRGEQFDERMDLSNLDSWRDSPPSPPPAAGETDDTTEGPDMEWWPPLSTAPYGRLERPQAIALASFRHYPAAETSARSFPPTSSRSVSGRDTSLRANGSHTTRGLSNTDSSTASGSRSRGLSARQQMAARRAARGVDGLGDRDRSLSPEVWDTLLSTLAADSQTPSAGSSFASVAASRTADLLSGTPSTDPDVVDEVQMETACESGCEYSDNELETADYEPPDDGRTRRRQQQPARDVASRGVRPRRVPDFNLDGMSEPYRSNMSSTASEPPSILAAPAAQRARNSGDGRLSRHINTPSGSLTIYESTMRLGSSAEVSRQSASHARSTSQSNHDEASPPSQRDHSAQDEERGIRDGPQRGQGAPRWASTAGPSPAEDEWAGMQRIVRSLARREDIPDGWWAEAGLSRILHQRADGSNLNVHSITDPF
ncbi:hypothetical protein E4U42_004628 [Claviceps africana]|uniref:Uncharacterized protein n=1 Tax=Claviceps africana TaxID=83212 RepID=A0A8K0J765_9HYPO|nr:hypothetical protein E4U42_004628 [Claviceps africana]